MGNGQITLKITIHTKNSLHTKIVTYKNIQQVYIKNISPLEAILKFTKRREQPIIKTHTNEIGP